MNACTWMASICTEHSNKYTYANMYARKTYYAT